MCTGDTPFQDHGDDQMTLFKGIVKGQYRISPLTTDKDVIDLLKRILVTKPQYRLGNLAGGAMDSKNMPWLKDVDFCKLSKKVYRAPWTPSIKDTMDVTAFDIWEHKGDDDEDEEDQRYLTAEKQMLFANLSMYN
jgi:serine/threonine protein kinase